MAIKKQKRVVPEKRKEMLLGLLTILGSIFILTVAIKTFVPNTAGSARGIPEITAKRQNPATITYCPVVRSVKFKKATNEPSKTVAVKGDSFWRIAKRVCGTGKRFEFIKAQNGYRNRTLKPGDVIEVNCQNS